MDYTTIAISILSSTLLASLISGIVSIWLRRLDFKYEYRKAIIDKRLETYEFIEALMADLKSSVLDNDGLMYHLIFSLGQQEFEKFQLKFYLIGAKSIWINSRTRDALIKMNRIFVNIGREYDLSKELIVAGKRYYRDIALLRDEVENCMQKDFLSLDDLEKLLKIREPHSDVFQSTNEVFKPNKN